MAAEFPRAAKVFSKAFSLVALLRHFAAPILELPPVYFSWQHPFRVTARLFCIPVTVRWGGCELIHQSARYQYCWVSYACGTYTARTKISSWVKRGRQNFCSLWTSSTRNPALHKVWANDTCKFRPTFIRFQIKKMK